ncbi:MAG TPA: hypothetical protein VH684_29605 [Xanthobacteraceae bacterium]
MASILFVTWAFVPPYFQSKWLSETDQSDLLFTAIPYVITIYFAY